MSENENTVLMDTWKAITDLALIVSEIEDKQTQFDIALVEKIKGMQEKINEIEKMIWGKL